MAENDTTNDGGTGEGTGSAVTPPVTPPAGTPAAGDPSPVPLTDAQQATVDRIVAQRLSRARKQWDEEQAEAARKAELTEVERTKAEVGEKDREAKGLARKVAQMERETGILLAAAGAGVRGDQMPRFLKLAGTEDGELDAATVTANVLRDFPELKAGPGRSGGSFDEGPVTTTLAEFQAMNTLERIALKERSAEVFAALQEQEVQAFRQARPAFTR